MLFKKLHQDVPDPIRGSAEAAGIDLALHDPSLEDEGFVSLAPKSRYVFKTGLSCALPEGFVGYIRPRSKLAVKHGIDVLAGVIDSDYRGEIMVCLINHGNDYVTLKNGDRIAQFVVHTCAIDAPVIVDELPETIRGAAGINDAQVDLRLQ